MLKKIHSLFYGWWIVLASFVLLVITGGTALYGFTAFFNPISSEMKWGSAAISFAFSLRSVEGGVLQPFIGIFVERLGVRKCIFVGISIMGFSLFLLSRMTSLTTFYVGFVLLSLGFSMAAGIPEFTAVANWFKKRRSLALGLLTTGFGVSGLMTPIIAMMIRSIGWRETMFLLCPFILVIGIPLSLFIRDRPESYGMQPDGDLPEVNLTGKTGFQGKDLGLHSEASPGNEDFLDAFTLCLLRSVRLQYNSRAGNASPDQCRYFGKVSGPYHGRLFFGEPRWPTPDFLAG